jgi:hypothetical protein
VLLLQDVLAGSAAAAALKPGDLLVAVAGAMLRLNDAGAKTATLAPLMVAAETWPIDTPLYLTVLRPPPRTAARLLRQNAAAASDGSSSESDADAADPQPAHTRNNSRRKGPVQRAVYVLDEGQIAPPNTVTRAMRLLHLRLQRAPVPADAPPGAKGSLGLGVHQGGPFEQNIQVAGVKPSAAASGIRSGDLICGVDAQPLPLSYSRAIGLLRAAGDVMFLDVLRELPPAGAGAGPMTFGGASLQLAAGPDSAGAGSRGRDSVRSVSPLVRAGSTSFLRGTGSSGNVAAGPSVGLTTASRPRSSISLTADAAAAAALGSADSNADAGVLVQAAFLLPVLAPVQPQTVLRCEADDALPNPALLMTPAADPPAGEGEAEAGGAETSSDSASSESVDSETDLPVSEEALAAYQRVSAREACREAAAATLSCLRPGMQLPLAGAGRFRHCTWSVAALLKRTQRAHAAAAAAGGHWAASHRDEDEDDEATEGGADPTRSDRKAHRAAIDATRGRVREAVLSASMGFMRALELSRLRTHPLNAVGTPLPGVGNPIPGFPALPIDPRRWLGGALAAGAGLDLGAAAEAAGSLAWLQWEVCVAETDAARSRPDAGAASASGAATNAAGAAASAIVGTGTRGAVGGSPLGLHLVDVSLSTEASAAEHAGMSPRQAAALRRQAALYGRPSVVMVAAVAPGSAAAVACASLAPGDVLLGVNGRSIAGLAAASVRRLLRCAPRPVALRLQSLVAAPQAPARRRGGARGRTVLADPAALSQLVAGRFVQGVASAVSPDGRSGTLSAGGASIHVSGGTCASACAPVVSHPQSSAHRAALGARLARVTAEAVRYARELQVQLPAPFPPPMPAPMADPFTLAGAAAPGSEAAAAAAAAGAAGAAAASTAAAGVNAITNTSGGAGSRSAIGDWTTAGAIAAHVTQTRALAETVRPPPEAPDVLADAGVLLLALPASQLWRITLTEERWDGRFQLAFGAVVASLAPPAPFEPPARVEPPAAPEEAAADRQAETASIHIGRTGKRGRRGRSKRAPKRRVAFADAAAAAGAPPPQFMAAPAAPPARAVVPAAEGAAPAAALPSEAAAPDALWMLEPGDAIDSVLGLSATAIPTALLRVLCQPGGLTLDPWRSVLGLQRCSGEASATAAVGAAYPQAPGAQPQPSGAPLGSSAPAPAGVTAAVTSVQGSGSGSGGGAASTAAADALSAAVAEAVDQQWVVFGIRKRGASASSLAGAQNSASAARAASSAAHAVPAAVRSSSSAAFGAARTAGPDGAQMGAATAEAAVAPDAGAELSWLVRRVENAATPALCGLTRKAAAAGDTLGNRLLQGGSVADYGLVPVLATAAGADVLPTVCLPADGDSDVAGAAAGRRGEALPPAVHPTVAQQRAAAAAFQALQAARQEVDSAFGQLSLVDVMLGAQTLPTVAPAPPGAGRGASGGIGASVAGRANVSTAPRPATPVQPWLRRTAPLLRFAQGLQSTCYAAAAAAAVSPSPVAASGTAAAAALLATAAAAAQALQERERAYVLLQHSTDGALTAAVLALFEYLVAHSHALLQRLPAGEGAAAVPLAAFGNLGDDASGAGSKAALVPYEQLMALLEEFCMLQQATQAAASEAAATAAASLAAEVHSTVPVADQAALEPLEAVSWLQFRSFFEAVDRTFGTAELCALLAALYPPGIAAAAPTSVQQQTQQQMQTQQQRLEAWAPELRVAALLDADAMQDAAVAAEEAAGSPGAAPGSQDALPLALRTCSAAAVASPSSPDIPSASGVIIIRPSPATIAAEADAEAAVALAPVLLTAVTHAAQHPSNLVPALRQAAYLLARASEAALALHRLTPRLARAAAAAAAAAAATGAQTLPAPIHTRTPGAGGAAAGVTSGRGARAADRWLLLRVHARSAVARALLSGCPPAGLAAASPRFVGRGLATAAPLQQRGAAAHAAAALAAPSLSSSVAPAAGAAAVGAGAPGCRRKRASVRKTAARAAAATVGDGSRSAEARVIVYRPTPHRRYSPVGPGSVPLFLEYVAAQQAEQAEKAEKARALVPAAANTKLKRSGSGVMLRL